MFSSRVSFGSSPHRFRRLLILSAGLIGLLAATSAGATERDSILWNNAAGGDWSDAANWSPANVPDAPGEAAVLKPLSGGYEVTLDANTTVGGLLVEGGGPALSVRGALLMIEGVPFNRGTIRIEDGGTVRAFHGYMQNRGGRIVAGPGGGVFSTLTVWDVGGTIENTPGGTLVADGGDLTLHSGTIVNGEVQRIGSEGAVKIFIATPQNLVVAPNGELWVAGQIDLMANGSSLINDGTVRVTGRLNVGGSPGNSVSLSGGGVLVLDEGILDTPAGATLINAAGHTIRGCGTILANLLNLGMVETDCEFSTLLLFGTIDNRSVIRVPRGLFWITGAPAHVWNAGTISGTGGRIWIDGGATLDNTPGGVFATDRGAVELGKALSSCTVMGGRLDGTGGAIFYSQGTTNLYNVTIGPTAVLLTTGGATTNATGTRLLNQGTHRIAAQGRVTVNTFTDYIQTGGALVLEGGSLIASRPVQIQGGALRGIGTIAASVTNGGQVIPDAGSGSLRIQGDYRQLSGGRLNVGLAGPGADQISRLEVTGAAFLDGTMEAATIGGFDPAPGTSFEVLSYGSFSGQFSEYVNPPGELDLVPRYGRTGFGLMVPGVLGTDDPARAPAALRFYGRPGAGGAGEASFVLELPREAVVTVRAYDAGGREVARLADGPRPAGVHRFSLVGTGGASRTLTSGVYFARALVQSGGQVETRTARVVVMR